jgi:hypothetical protein
MTNQERLQEIYRKALAQLGELDEEFQQRLYQDLRLQVEYENEYVAYADEWVEQGAGGARRLTRHVLAHGQDIGEVLKAIRQRDKALPRWEIAFMREHEGSTVML